MTQIRVPISRVVCARTDRLGETVLTLPAIADVRAALPGAALTVLAHPALQPFIAEVPEVDYVLTHDPTARAAWWARAWRLSRALRTRRFDLAMIFNAQKEVHLAAWLAGIPIRVGYDRKWAWCLSHRIADRKSLGERHEVEYNRDVVKVLGFPTVSEPWRLRCSEHATREILQLLERQGIKPSIPWIAVHPWSSNPLKQWPPERYVALIRAVTTRYPVVLIGGPEERSGASEIIPGPPARVVNLVGRLTLVQLAALLRHARLLVSNDSGPVHLAAAVKTRTVVLFGTTSAASGPRRWGPWGDGHTVLCKPSVGDITVAEVLTAVEQASHASVHSERTSADPDR